jgi:hypothetical protein
VVRLSSASASLRLATLFTLFAITSRLPILRTRLGSRGTAWPPVARRPGRGLRNTGRGLRCGRVFALPTVIASGGTGSRFSAIFIGRILLFVGHFVRKGEA